jgi:hypothetical protein
MENKNYFIKFFLIFLSLFSLIKIYDHAINLETFQYGEWLINYQFGFVRRGLFGEIIYLLSYIFNKNMQISFFLVLSLICLFYYFLSYLFIKNTKFNILHYLIFFSPLFYIFFVIISKVGIRKEIILYIYYLLYLIFLSSNQFTIKRNWKFILTFPLLILNHEGVFFFFPYIILPLLFIVNFKDFKKLITQILTLISFSTLVMIIVYINKGTYDHTLQICSSLGNYAPHKCDWWGAISALSKGPLISVDNLPMSFFYLKASFESWIGFLFYIIYGFAPIIYFFYSTKSFKKNFIQSKKILLIYILILFICSLPLFHVAEDWSRWFSVHFHLLAFLLIFFQKIKLEYSNKNLNLIYNNTKQTKNKFKIIFIFILFLYATSLHHTHFFFKGTKLEFTYYKIYQKIKNIY